MKVLLTSTSFIDTPGQHQDKLYNSGLEIDTLRGPIREAVLLPIISEGPLLQLLLIINVLQIAASNITNPGSSQSDVSMKH